VPAPHTGSGDTGLKKKQDGTVSKYQEEPLFHHRSRLGDTGLKIKPQNGTLSKYQEEQGSRLGDIGLEKKTRWNVKQIQEEQGSRLGDIGLKIKQQDGTVSKYQDEQLCQNGSRLGDIGLKNEK
jgi:hypothetical protein